MSVDQIAFPLSQRTSKDIITLYRSGRTTESLTREPDYYTGVIYEAS